MHLETSATEGNVDDRRATVRICRPESLPGVEVVETVDARHGYRGSREYLDHFAVWTVTNGISRSHVGNRMFEISPGTTLALAPGALLAATHVPCGVATASMLRIDPEALNRLAGGRGEVATQGLPHWLAPEGHRAVCRLVDAALRADDVARADELSALFEDVVSTLLTRADREEDTMREDAPRCLQRVRRLLHDRFADDLSLSDMAREGRLPRESLVRRFHAAYGAPPHEYLMYVRVASARALLARGTSATDTAFACGFCDQSHLNRWFKKVLGVTPGQYARAAW